MAKENFAAIKRRARTDLDNELNVPAALIRSGSATQEDITARLLQAPLLAGDIDYQGHAELYESHMLVVVPQSLQLKRNDTLVFAEYNRTVTLDVKRPRTDTAFDTWEVKEV